MKALDYKAITTSQQYDKFLRDLYVGVKSSVEEVVVPVIKILAVEGNQPPGSAQYQTAIACLYGIAYTLRMGLKFDKLPRPSGYFDYKVGALGSQWWSVDGDQVDVANPKTLRWRAYLIVPAFIETTLVDQAREQARAKHPETPYELVQLEELNEGTALQIMHIGPYDAEEPTIAKISDYAAHGLQLTGHHNELYISDPRRTKPERLKTVIRHPVAASEAPAVGAA